MADRVGEHLGVSADHEVAGRSGTPAGPPAPLPARINPVPGCCLLNRRTVTVRRPRQFFRADGPMPEVHTLELVIPPELGDGDEFRNVLRERVAAVEAEAAEERRRTGRRVLGRRAILRQSWRDSPSSHEPRRTLSPRVAAHDKWARIDALLRQREFLDAYRAARALLLLRQPAIFPAGTYWLRRFASVPVSPLPVC